MIDRTGKNRWADVGGIALVACLFVGIALGILFGEVAVGTLLGLGAGFLALALARAVLR